MRGARCQGFMVEDRFLDMGQADIRWAFVWRCINCGEVLDAVIQHHRCSSNLVVGRKQAQRARLPNDPTLEKFHAGAKGLEVH
jgi:hypothetical protein